MLIQDLSKQRCTIILVADGFKETETIVLLALLRQAGVCVKSMGPTSGLIVSAHGVRFMPDLTLADLDSLADTAFIDAVILPEGSQSLSRLETDPRVHRLLRRVIAQRGLVITNAEGLRLLRAATLWADELGSSANGDQLPVLLREPRQSLESFAQRLVSRLKQLSCS